MKTHTAFLVAAILMFGVGAAFIFHVPLIHILTFAGLGLLGTATVTYKYPVSGTVPPTVAIMRYHNEVNALVNAGDADTVITIVHNWGEALKDFGGFPDGPSGLFPVVVINVESDSSTTVQPFFTVSLASTNQVVINKPTTVGTQGSFIVQVLRPTSLAR